MSVPGGNSGPAGPDRRPLLVCRNAVFPKGGGFQRRPLRHMGGENAAYAHLVVSLEHGVDVVRVERVDAVHVLHGGDAAMQAFHGADQRTRPQLAAGPAGEAGRQAQHAPKLNRYRFKEAFQQRVVRVVMRVDKARQHEVVTRVDHRRPGMERPQARADRGDAVAFDEDVRRRRVVRVAVVIVNQAARHQHRRTLLAPRLLARTRGGWHPTPCASRTNAC